MKHIIYLSGYRVRIFNHELFKEDLIVPRVIEGRQTSVIELKVAKEDIGKIIGKQGRTAMAIRTILNAAAMKLRKRFVLEIMEQNPSSQYVHDHS